MSDSKNAGKGPFSSHADDDGHSHESGSMWCFQCGNEYDADVEECTECGVPTSDQMPTEADQVGDPDDDQIAYELHEWTGQSRSILNGMLTRSGIDHAWQGATLIVREADEEAVDEAVAQTEIAEMPTLDLSQPTVVYELNELEQEQHGRLLRRLNDTGMSHAFDQNGDLFVYERDEAKVDALFEGLDEVDASEREFGPGNDANPLTVMSDMFVAVGRLRKNPADAKGTVALAENAALAQEMTLPYGLGAQEWGDIVDTSDELNAALAGEIADMDDVDIDELATHLHGLLRRLV